ncbi:MAG: NADP-specific glutamate dehydrogenase [Chitinispirillia bacterium]|nr:NADP-specific glutamate dehydrogenase [Chitinispirillia bacterium]
MSFDAAAFMEVLKARNPGEKEFYQATEEVVHSLAPFISKNPKYAKAKILERMAEPERAIIFRIPWVDDKGEIQVNRGIRIQMNSAIGPYKGGIRFHPSVTLSVLKFLAFEQTFKNSLTTLPMGGGKGGCDFDPKGKSDNEVMRFCQAFMAELYRHIGPDLDVPAGDIGVGAREVGYMFGMYKKLKNEVTGVFTGKKVGWGGSLIRPEATGYGCVYFCDEMMKVRGMGFEGKTVVISGSGNVAQYACQKATELGAKVVTLSDSNGSIYDPDGITPEKFAFIQELKNVKRGRIKEYADHYKCQYMEGARPWSIKCDVALPCATQNELNEDEAKTLIKNGCICVGEGANMPSVPGAVKAYLDAKIMYGPGKAANAGGVSTSGLEMTQNSMRLSWSRVEVDTKLKGIMKAIHEQCCIHGKEDGNFINYVNGGNIAGFVKVADAMIDQGVI